MMTQFDYLYEQMIEMLQRHKSTIFCYTKYIYESEWACKLIVASFLNTR
jgi:hypothetical protein